MDIENKQEKQANESIIEYLLVKSRMKKKKIVIRRKGMKSEKGWARSPGKTCLGS